MVVRSAKLLSDGYFELDMGMLVYGKTPYYGKKYMAALKPLLVRTDSDNILIDTGIGELPEDYKKYYNLDRKPTLIDSLATEDLAPEDISIVINTHLHADHCGNNRLFSNARFIVQKAELEYARHPHRFLKGGYIPELFEGLKFETVEGDVNILPGISVILTGGHTPGHQVVLVDASETTLAQKIVYCGDESPLEENLQKKNITGILYSQVKSYETLERLAKLDALFIYSHERKQLQI
jgi:glyoxylase-like metal-dependent hydrolase (beta-lactamase superfamily II)